MYTGGLYKGYHKLSLESSQNQPAKDEEVNFGPFVPSFRPLTHSRNCIWLLHTRQRHPLSDFLPKSPLAIIKQQHPPLSVIANLCPSL